MTGDGPNFATASVSMQKMMVMIREIKQAARAMLSWIFDDWLELRGQQDKTLQFLFNDLDPSDAVDFKRLLIELYDRKLISRSSLQLKMDLDPDIEAANRKTEGAKVDLLDQSQVKPIVDMVVAGILSVEAAQELLGLAPTANTPPAGQAEAGWFGGARAQAAAVGLCDDCYHFDPERGWCRVHTAERAFDAPGCRFLDSSAAAGR